MRIQNSTFASNLYAVLALLVTSLCSSAFASQATIQPVTPTGAQVTVPTTENRTLNNPLPPSQAPLKAVEKASASDPISLTRINWSQLNSEQKTALALLANEWDKMDALRQKKWLGVANKYANMKPEEQQRVQERIQTWGKMTPEQRMAVRENFANTSKKTPEQKSAQWQQYQQLSDAEKLKLANEAKAKKTITTIQPESKRLTPSLAPLKKGPPPVNPTSSSASQASIK